MNEPTLLPSEPVIVAESLSKSFSGVEDVRAVDDISFALPRGRMIALKGPSGCGKSTLLNLLGALDRATSGTLQIDGTDITKLSGKDETAYRRHKVGFVFQSFNLLPQLSALENVMLPMEFAGVGRAEQTERAHQLLRQVGLKDDRHDHRPAKLSGGQQQRVAVARAIANNPPIVLADEPTANLDGKTGRMIVELLHGLCQDGRTVIVATHDAAIADQADLILEMEDGQLTKQPALSH